MNSTLEMTSSKNLSTTTSNSKNIEINGQSLYLSILENLKLLNESVPKRNNRPHGMIAYARGEVKLYAEKIDAFIYRHQVALCTLGGLIYGAMSSFYWCLVAHHAELLHSNYIGLPIMFTTIAVCYFSLALKKAMTSNSSIEKEELQENKIKGLSA